MTVYTLCLNLGQKSVIVGMITGLVGKLLHFFFFDLGTYYIHEFCCQLLSESFLLAMDRGIYKDS